MRLITSRKWASLNGYHVPPHGRSQRSCPQKNWWYENLRQYAGTKEGRVGINVSDADKAELFLKRST